MCELLMCFIKHSFSKPCFTKSYYSLNFLDIPEPVTFWWCSHSLVPVIETVAASMPSVEPFAVKLLFFGTIK